MWYGVAFGHLRLKTTKSPARTHTWNGSLPHGNIICAVRYDPHGEATKTEEHEEEAWKRRKKKSVQATNRLKPATSPAKAGHRLNPALAPAIAGYTS
jgi:hypothetical protein